MRNEKRSGAACPHLLPVQEHLTRYHAFYRCIFSQLYNIFWATVADASQYLFWRNQKWKIKLIRAIKLRNPRSSNSQLLLAWMGIKLCSNPNIRNIWIYPRCITLAGQNSHPRVTHIAWCWCSAIWPVTSSAFAPWKSKRSFGVLKSSIRQLKWFVPAITAFFRWAYFQQASECDLTSGLFSHHNPVLV